MLIDDQQREKLHGLANAAHGLFLTLEEHLRWQAARLLIRWNELIIRGEDDNSPGALAMKKNLDDFFGRLQRLETEVRAEMDRIAKSESGVTAKSNDTM